MPAGAGSGPTLDNTGGSGGRSGGFGDPLYNSGLRIELGWFGIPVGLGGIPYYIKIPSLSGLPELVQVPTPPETITTAPEIDRRDVTSDPEVIPDVIPFYATEGSLTAQDVAELAALGSEVIWTTPGYAGPVAQAAPAQIINSQEDDVGWFEDLYDQIDTGLGGWLPGGVPPGLPLPTPAFNTPVGGAAPTPVPMPPATVMPIAAPGAGCAPVDPMKGYVLKKYCGQWRWIKQKSSRRKRLATRSDIRDISALKGVLGNGKNLQAWIATHSN